MICSYCLEDSAEVAVSSHGVAICGACVSAASLSLQMGGSPTVPDQPETENEAQQVSYPPFSRPGETEAIEQAGRDFGLSR
jgi:hypothetical protein